MKTPFLDSLAARGIVFTNAHAHNVVTLASHTNILTGLYPYQHGIRDNAGFVLDPKFPTIGAMLKKAGYATAAFVSAFPLDGRFGLNRGFDVYDDRYREASDPLDFVVQERPAEETLASAKRWYDAAPPGKKFFWIHLYDPHAPYEAPRPYREQYKDSPYLGEVAYTDDQLGKFLGPLLKAHPNTVVIITADHGEALGDHGEQTHGLFAYESTLKVPLMVIDPENAYKWLAVDGRAALTTDGADEQIDKLAKKYTGADEYPNRVEGKQRVKVRIAPEHVTASGF